MANRNLHAAKAAKNDEFYTEFSDINKELQNYRAHFQGKTVFLNCDDPKESKFYIFFALNFERWGLEKLIGTHYCEEGTAHKVEITRGENGLVEVVTALEGNGDFRSDESIALLQEADIVVTNPPFSLFREYVAQLMEHNKKFLIIGSLNAITYKEIFSLIKDNRIWLGIENGSKSYRVPDNYEGKCEIVDGVKMAKLGNTGWFTNLEHPIRNLELICVREYEHSKEHHGLFPTYDNYDAIEVSKVVDIPSDYNNVMGVPITFLTKYNPAQFEIIGLDRYVEGNRTPNKRFTLGGKEVYARIAIRHKR